MDDGRRHNWDFSVDVNVSEEKCGIKDTADYRRIHFYFIRNGKVYFQCNIHTYNALTLTKRHIPSSHSYYATI